jgi:hypothetical protein
MASTVSLTSYRLEVEWLLTWFPIQGNSAIDNQKTRGGTFHYLNTDDPFAAGNGLVHLLGQGPQAPFAFGDALSSNNVALAFITVTVNQDDVFSLALEAHLGKNVRHSSLLAPPNVRLPFMLNIIHPAGDRETEGTALSLYGTITTAKRPLDLIASAFQPGKIEITRSGG